MKRKICQILKRIRYDVLEMNAQRTFLKWLVSYLYLIKFLVSREKLYRVDDIRIVCCNNGVRPVIFKLKMIEEDRYFSQNEIAKILNCSQTTYSRYETGDLNIPVDSLIKLAIYFNTSIDYLTGLTDEKKPYKSSVRTDK